MANRLRLRATPTDGGRATVRCSTGAPLQAAAIGWHRRRPAAQRRRPTVTPARASSPPTGPLPTAVDRRRGVRRQAPSTSSLDSARTRIFARIPSRRQRRLGPPPDARRTGDALVPSRRRDAVRGRSRPQRRRRSRRRQLDRRAGRTSWVCRAMTAVAITSRRSPVPTSASTGTLRCAKPAALVAFVGVLAYLVLDAARPAAVEGVRRRRRRVPHGVHRPRGSARRSRYTVGLAFGSLAIALVLGTLLAWAASRLPPTAAHPARAARPADRRARDRQRRRLGVPAVAAARLPQRRAAQPAVVVGPRRGPDRHLHDAVDRHHHRLRADGVRVPVRQRRVREHQRRAPRGRPGRRLVASGACSSASRCRCCARR